MGMAMRRGGAGSGRWRGRTIRSGEKNAGMAGKGRKTLEKLE
jgi:hypothetical protein